VISPARRGWSVGLAVAGLLLAQDTRPVFRSSVTAVAVNVSVRDGNVPVTTLGPDDFTVRDNGVAQTVLEVQREAVPFDVTLIVDVSGSTHRAHDVQWRDTQGMAALLRPTDTIRILTIGTLVDEVLPPHAAPATVAPPTVGRENSAVYDALAAALLRHPDPGRRRLVVAMTDGGDNVSVVSAETVAMIAKQTDAVLQLILIPIPAGPPPPAGFQGAPTFMHRPADLGLLSAAALATGGGSRAFAGDPVPEFQAVFDQFRQGYVVRYSPSGVAPTGWHVLQVDVHGPRPYTVQARSGYFGG